MAEIAWRGSGGHIIGQCHSPASPTLEWNLGGDFRQKRTACPFERLAQLYLTSLEGMYSKKVEGHFNRSHW